MDEPLRTLFEIERHIKIIYKTNNILDVISVIDDSAIEIAQHGWYWNLANSISFIREVTTLFKDGLIEEGYEKFILYYHENLDSIVVTLRERHPEWSNVLNEVESGYKNGLYSLIIPVLFCIIDGICYKFNKKKFFKTSQGRISEFYKDFCDIYSRKRFGGERFSKKTSINRWEKDVPKCEGELNRHEVIHGINTEFGTKVNFLKALSLLVSISDLMESVKNESGTV